MKSASLFGLIIFLNSAFFYGQVSHKSIAQLQLQLSKSDTTHVSPVADTTLCRILKLMCDSAGESEATSLNQKIIRICKINLNKKTSNNSKLTRCFKEYLANALNNTGYIEELKNQWDKAIEYYSKAMILDIELNNIASLALTYNSLGNIYTNRGNIPLGLDYFNKSLKMNEALEDTFAIASCINNIASIYSEQNETQKAMELHLRALDLRKKTKDTAGIIRSLNNLAVGYSSLNNPIKSEENLLEAMRLAVTSNNEGALVYCYSNLGILKQEAGDLNKALEYYLKAEKIYSGQKNRDYLSQVITNISRIHFKLGNIELALKKANIALEIGQEAGFAENIRNASELLYSINKSAGHFKDALNNYELFIKMHDSINNETNRKASIKSQLKYEYEKQAAADSVAHAKESEIKNVQLQKQTAEINAKKNQQCALFGGLGLVIIFAGFMFNRFKVTQKQKIIIEHQKEIVEEQKKLVEEKQKEVLDSIHYARRIQMAQIPSEKQIAKTLERIKKI